MTALVVGCGSIGQRHLRNLRALGVDVLAYDVSVERAMEVAERSEAALCRSLEEGWDRKPTMALICTPPHLHVAQALQAVKAGCHTFVEKPLGHSLEQVDELVAESIRRERSLCVGYNLRFHAGLIRLKQLIEANAIGRVLSIRAEFGQYLPDWRPERDYRQGYTARREMGGGIILDGSHEIDYVQWLGEEVEAVSCVAGRLGTLEMDVEDTAEIILRMKKGVLAQVRVDCIQRDYARACKVIGDMGTLVWDFKKGLSLFSADTGRWEEEAITPDVNDMYVEELKHFLSCARGTATPVVGAAAGKRVLEIALAAKRSAVERREVVLCQL